MEGVMIVKDDDIGMYRCTKRQKNSIHMMTSMTDDIELRENQAENLYNTAFKNLLTTSSDAAQDFVLCSMGSDSNIGGGHCPTLMIKNTTAQKTIEDSSTVASKTDTTTEQSPEDLDVDSTDQDMMSGFLKAFGAVATSAPKAKARAKTNPKPKSSTAPSTAATTSTRTRSTGGDEHVAKTNVADSAAAGAEAKVSKRGLDWRDATKRKESVSDDTGRANAKTTVGASSDPSAWSLPELPPTKKGRVSANILQEADERFLDEMSALIDMICDTNLPETSESDLVQFSKDASAKTRDVISKCATKMGQIKRRKHSTEDDSQYDKPKEINHSASLFNRLFNELSNSAPKAGELEHLMSQLSAPPLSYRSLMNYFDVTVFFWLLFWLLLVFCLISDKNLVIFGRTLQFEYVRLTVAFCHSHSCFFWIHSDSYCIV